MKLLKAISKKIADFQTFLILSAVFFLLTPIFSLISRKKNKRETGSWEKWSMPADTISQLKKQY